MGFLQRFGRQLAASVAWAGAEVFKPSSKALLEPTPIEQREQEDLFIFQEDTGLTRVSDEEFDRIYKVFKSGEAVNMEAEIKKLEP